MQCGESGIKDAFGKSLLYENCEAALRPPSGLLWGAKTKSWWKSYFPTACNELWINYRDCACITWVQNFYHQNILSNLLRIMFRKSFYHFSPMWLVPFLHCVSSTLQENAVNRQIWKNELSVDVKWCLNHRAMNSFLSKANFGPPGSVCASGFVVYLRHCLDHAQTCFGPHFQHHVSIRG